MVIKTVYSENYFSGKRRKRQDTTLIRWLMKKMTEFVTFIFDVFSKKRAICYSAFEYLLYILYLKFSVVEIKNDNLFSY